MSDDEDLCFKFGNLSTMNLPPDQKFRVRSDEIFHVNREELSIFKSINEENLSALNYYISQGGEVDRHLDNGANLLQIAVELGKEKSLEFLLEKGAKPNEKGTRLYRMTGKDLQPRLYTPIESAAVFNRPKMIKILLNFGGNAHSTNAEGETALSLAISCGATESASFLRELTASKLSKSQELIMAAILYANENRLQKVLKERIDLDFSCSDGSSPVFLAIENGFYDCLQILLESGANSNIICKRIYPNPKIPNSNIPGNWTALDSAVIHGNLAIMELLISHGANVYYEDSEGRTALTVALLYNRPAAADLLKRRAPDLMERTVRGKVYQQLLNEHMSPFDRSLTFYETEPPTADDDDNVSYDWDTYLRWVDSQYGIQSSTPVPSTSGQNLYEDFNAPEEELGTEINASSAKSTRSVDYKIENDSCGVTHEQKSSSPIPSTSGYKLHEEFEATEEEGQGSDKDSSCFKMSHSLGFQDGKQSSSPVPSTSGYNRQKNFGAHPKKGLGIKQGAPALKLSANSCDDSKNSSKKRRRRKQKKSRKHSGVKEEKN